MKLTKKLFIAIMTMALLVVTFSASTFAWFTLGQTSEIETFNVNITSGLGMEVSEDGKTWTNNLHINEGSDIEFIDLTSADGKVIKKWDSGQLVTVDAADKNYLEYSFYVRITKVPDGQKSFDVIYLSEVTGTSADDIDWVCDVDFGQQYEEGETYKWDAIGALRLSATKASADPRFVYEFVAGDNDKGTAAVDGLAKAYADAKEFDIPDEADLPETIKDADLTYENAVVLEKDDFDITAIDGVDALDDRYIYAKVTVRIWLEGWDADCINAILSQQTSVKFKLTAHNEE